jgi:predicted site-specific integrase-resolvase
MDEYMSVRVAAQQLSVTPRTVQYWIRNGLIVGAYQPVEGQTMPWLIPSSEVERIKQEREAKKK